MINPRRAPWEEQAFAEDASGFFGGCVWPPKSYYCSFCRREFASAQALGGHMNVHRREKARLRVRQSSSIPQTEVVPQNDALNPWTSYDAPYLHSNPKPEEVSDTRSLVSPSLPVFQRNHKNSFVSSPLASWSSSFAEKRDDVSDSIKKEEKRSTIVETVSRAEKEDFITEDLSLNLIFCKKQTKTSSKEEVVACKRRRTEEKPFCFFPKLSAIADRRLPQSEVFELRSGSVEELDLELRLGDGSKLN